MEIELDSKNHGDAVALAGTDMSERMEVAMRREVSRISGGGSPCSPSFRTDVSGICRSAAGNGLRAESVVIAMKAAWQAIPETRSFARPIAMDSLFDQMVTLTLDEFYECNSSADDHPTDSPQV